MSEVPPRRPDQAPPGSPPPRGGGSVLLGILVGILFFGALGGLSILLASAPAPWWLIPGAVVAYLVVAVVLAARPRTARFGAGLAIAIGVALLIGAGLCVALLAGAGGAIP
jgi:hypothetical protein